MRSLLLAGFAALLAAPLSAHGCGPRVVVRGGFWAPRPLVVLRPAPICLEPAPVVIYHHGYGHRHGWRRRW